MKKLTKADNSYKEWIEYIKTRIRQSLLKAAVKVNAEMLRLYGSIDEDIVQKKLRWTYF